MRTLVPAALICFTMVLSACTDDGEVEDLDMAAEDFDCILDWTQVDRLRIVNKLGYQEEAEAVARSADGGVYPVGTVIQLIPFEAMVKRHDGWNDATGDWEFFTLEPTAEGTTILSRGGEEVVNPTSGSTCAGCHGAAEPQWDSVCARGHGCEPLPFTAEQIEMAQQSDPRCQ